MSNNYHKISKAQVNVTTDALFQYEIDYTHQTKSLRYTDDNIEKCFGYKPRACPAGTQPDGIALEGNDQAEMSRELTKGDFL